MGERPGMHHGGAPGRRPPDRSRIKEIIAVHPVKADDLMAQPHQKRRDRPTHLPTMPGDQNPHEPIIAVIVYR